MKCDERGEERRGEERRGEERRAKKLTLKRNIIASFLKETEKASIDDSKGRRARRGRATGVQ